jgi:hypothetical protein
MRDFPMNVACLAIVVLACGLAESPASAQSTPAQALPAQSVPAQSVPAPNAPAPTSTADDRIVVSADGTTLTGTNGGGGASLGYLHNFDASTIVGVAVEHQVLSDAEWTFASLNGSATFGPENQRYSLYGEAHEGPGHDGLQAFHYNIEALGVIGTFNHKLSAQIEDRRIDVEATHGNLPKVGLSYLWGPHFMTTAAYQYSVSGNLGTRLPSVRIDSYWATVNLFGGAAWGPTSPVIFNLPTGLVSQVRQLKEGYIGASKPFPKIRGELTAVADYLDLSGIKKASLTISYIFHIG